MSAPDATRELDPPAPDDPSLVAARAACLNCGAALTGAYCAECGQHDLPATPTLREVLREAWTELANLDGKVATTLRALVLTPGFLTCEALAGRRAPYVTPLRLYLTISVVYFFVVASIPSYRPPSQLARDLRAASTRLDSLSARDRQRERDVRDADSTAAVGDRNVAVLPGGGGFGVLHQAIRRMGRDRPEASRRIANALPRLVFALLPVAALLVMLAYETSGRTYVQHLYFTLHLHAFAFLLFTASALVRYAFRVQSIAVPIYVVIAALLAYLVVSLRRVYGSSVGDTLMRAVTITGLYALALFAGFGVTLVIVGMTM